MAELFTVVVVNVQGLRSSLAALTAHLRLLKRKPNLVCITETHLNKAAEKVTLEGYDLVARKDRTKSRGRASKGKGGGVCVFAAKEVSKQVVHLKDSEDSERLWMTVHSDLGPYLVGVWYRPPSHNDTVGILSLAGELAGEEAVGVLVVGDMNVHHAGWLRYSRGVTSAEKKL